METCLARMSVRAAIVSRMFDEISILINALFEGHTRR